MNKKSHCFCRLNGDLSTNLVSHQKATPKQTHLLTVLSFYPKTLEIYQQVHVCVHDDSVPELLDLLTDNKYIKSADLPVIKTGWELKATQKLPSFIIEPQTRRKGKIIPQSSQISCIQTSAPAGNFSLWVFMCVILPNVVVLKPRELKNLLLPPESR